MGGGDDSSSFVSPPETDCFSSDDHSSLECLDDDDSHRSRDGLGFELEDEAVNPSGFHPGGFDQIGNNQNSPNHPPFNENWSWQLLQRAYIINSDRDSSARIESLNEAKRTLLSYSPGSWIDKEEGETLSDFDVPKTTTLLLVGFKKSGKSSLINRISRVFEDDKLAADRAQVSSLADGTYFLQRYMFPRQSSSFCLFDSRGLSYGVRDNEDLIKSWMTNGVRSGELVIRDWDYSSERTSSECKIRGGGMLAEPIRKVNFVIFVVDALSVLTYMNRGDNQCAEELARTYNFPYLSFRDDKPVIVVTHGDLLSLEQRTRVQIYLGELLGVPPTQIFDIPESHDPDTELAIVDMLRYALEHADKNLPRRSWTSKKLYIARSALGQVFKRYFIVLIFLVLALGMNVAMEGRLPLGHRAPWSESPVDHHRQQQQKHHHHEPLINRTETNRNRDQEICQPDDHNDEQSLLINRTESPVHHNEHPTTTTETHQPDNLDALNSNVVPNSSHSARNQPNELQRPSMQSTPNQKATDDPHRSSVRSKSQVSKHKSKDRQKKNRSRKHHKPAVSEPGISWKARQRLWLEEEPKSRDHPSKSPNKNRSHKQHKATVTEPEISWDARQRLWLAEE